jgi:predicted ABC-type ATPase
MLPSTTRPSIVLFGGPNGAGKSTIARTLLLEVFGVSTFVNADVIAAGLAGLAPEGAAVAAGRLMLSRIRALGDAHEPFAFESTLASRMFAPWIASLRRTGYRLHLVYVWLDTPERAIERVRARVLRGGHRVDDETIRRRYVRSAQNFARLYLPLADTCLVYSNSGIRPELAARRQLGETTISVRSPSVWESIQSVANATHDPRSPEV